MQTLFLQAQCCISRAICSTAMKQKMHSAKLQQLRTRMAEYRAKTAPILPIYEARGLVKRVDGMADIGHVTAAIEAILDGKA